jgi:hypothetical protein
MRNHLRTMTWKTGTVLVAGVAIVTLTPFVARLWLEFRFSDVCARTARIEVSFSVRDEPRRSYALTGSAAAAFLELTSTMTKATHSRQAIRGGFDVDCFDDRDALIAYVSLTPVSEGGLEVYDAILEHVIAEGRLRESRGTARLDQKQESGNSRPAILNLDRYW